MENILVVMLIVEAFILFTPLFFVFADLWSGLRKAKQRGEAITSKKYRNTVNKLSRYYNVLVSLGVIDALQLVCFWYMNTYFGWSVPLFPWLTLIGSIGVGAIETKSIMEPADKKEQQELKEIGVLAKAIAEKRSNPEEIAKAIIEYLKSEDR